MTSKELNPCSGIIRAFDEKGYQSPTAIQALATPHIMPGKDVAASAATGTGKTASFIESSPQSFIDESVYYVSGDDKRSLLKHVINEQKMSNVIVFARTRYGADKIAEDLAKGGISAEAFHGDRSQNARQRALTNFRRNLTRVLVATDIAARGIDIADLRFVINYELPGSAETYAHRIGRTGRAGKAGSALSFCDREERGYLNNINRISEQNLAVVEHPFT